MIVRQTHYVANPPSLLIASQTSRSASENTSIALALLCKTIITAAKSPIIGETSAEQKEKVKAHAVMENARRRFNKDKRKDTKAARRGEW
jgi:peptidyl-tRNA hydrolase ICT1